MSNTIHNDKLLTNFATGYKLGQRVADFIAPPFKVMRPGDKYAVYGKGSQRIWDNRVGKSGQARKIDLSATDANYACEKYALATDLYDDDRNNSDNPVLYEQNRVRNVLDSQQRAREYRVCAIAGSGSVVTQTSAPADWNTPSTGTPIADIRAALGTVQAAAQVIPNRIVIPDAVAINMIGTDEWADYFKYTSAQGLFDLVSGLRNLGLQTMQAGVFGGNLNEGVASDPGSESIWGEKVLVFYCEASPTLETRTFMYSPFVYMDRVERWRDNGADYDTVKVSEQIDELLVDASCAYLFTNCLA
jgi:hypothetical protein